jgi:hypothetical protein
MIRAEKKTLGGSIRAKLGEALEVALLLVLVSALAGGAAQEAAAEDAKNARALLQQGHQKKREGDLDGAMESYRAALAADPDLKAAKRSLERVSRRKTQVDYVAAAAPHCVADTIDDIAQMECLAGFFVYGGRPVHPLIVKEFLTWISDEGDQIVAIDVAGAQGSNRFCCDDDFTVKTGDAGELVARIEYGTEDSCGAPKGCWFEYAFVGRTDTGVQVVRTADSGGTSPRNDRVVLLLRATGIPGYLGRPAQLRLEKLGEGGVPWDVALDGDAVVSKGRRIELPVPVR